MRACPTEPDADATDTLVAVSSTGSLHLDGDTTLAIALKIFLQVMHLLENLGGVEGCGLGEDARRRE
jgi:hypothetical protein